MVERWGRVYPKSVLRWAGHDPRLHTEGEDIPTEVVATVAADASRVERLRRRLASLSWFTKCLKEPIARRANREDGCTGHFWEGRFRSHRLLDDAAVLACMVYNDLNVVRAGLAPTPEQSDYTSVQDRIHVRQHFRKLQGLRRRSPKRAIGLLSSPGAARAPRTAEDGIWLAPIDRGPREARDADVDPDARSGLLDLSLDQYLELVDATGRIARLGSGGGTIPADLRPILERLDVDVDRWVTEIATTSRLFGTAVGSASSRAREAVRRGMQRVVGALDVYRSG